MTHTARGIRTTVTIALCAGVIVPMVARAEQTSTMRTAHVRVTHHIEDDRAQLVRATVPQRVTTFDQMVQQRWRIAQARRRLAGTPAAGLDDGVIFVILPNMTALVPAGSHKDDVATVSFPTSSGSVVTVRDGRTGRVRWSKRYPDLFGLDVAALGPKHVPSLVLYQTTFTGTGQADPSGAEDTGEQVNSVLAVNAANGADIWTSAPVAGTYSVTDLGFTEANAIYSGGILHDKGGDRVLVARVSDSSEVIATADDEQPIVLDGVTGAQDASGTPVGGDEYAAVVPVGDVNSDGFEDWASFAGGDAAQVTVDSGADGSRLWTQPSVAGGFVFPLATPDLDGDHRADVVTVDFGGNTGAVTAYSGASGTSLWSRTADDAFVLGHLSAGNAIGLIAFAGQGFEVTAVTGKNVTAWHRVIAAPQFDGDGGVGIEAGPAGDVDADNVADLFMNMTVVSASVHGSWTYLLTGRTGRLTIGKSLGEPVYGSLDGHGDDFMSSAAIGKRWTATASDGATRHKLWTASLAVPLGVKIGGFPITVARLGADSRGLLMFFLEGRHLSLQMRDATTGRVDWAAS